MLQDAKIQALYFSLLPIAIFRESWYNIKYIIELEGEMVQKKNKVFDRYYVSFSDKLAISLIIHIKI